MERIDWDRVLELREEVGEDAFAEVLEMSVEEIDEVFDRLDAGAAEAGDLHFLKGAALNLGMAEFSAACRDGELALKEDPGAAVDVTGLRALYTAGRGELADAAA